MKQIISNIQFSIFKYRMRSRATTQAVMLAGGAA